MSRSYERRALLDIEGIPWPMSHLYNLMSGTRPFREQYDLTADHVLRFYGEGRVLDIGTGPARLLVSLHRKKPSLSLTGLDISPAMIRTAEKNLARAGAASEVKVLLGEAGRLPFEDETFDAVVSTGSFHHWRDQVAGLGEVHRVLKAGRHALIYDLVSEMPPEVQAEAVRRFGKFRTRLLRLHSLEEPFCLPRNLEDLAARSRFGQGRTEFVGVLCCLVMKKQPSGC